MDDQRPRPLGTNVGSAYARALFPPWVETSILTVLALVSLTAVFLLARFIGKKRGAIATPPRMDGLDLSFLGVVAFIAATFLPLETMRNSLEQRIPNPAKYVDLDTRLTPQTLLQTHYSPLYPATQLQIGDAEWRLAATLPQALKDMYLVDNGGGYAWLYLPTTENPRSYLVDWRPIAGPTGGSWRTLSKLGYASGLRADRDWKNTVFPPEAEDWIIISENWPYIIFLEKQESSMRVGFANMANDLTNENPLFLESFSSFIDAARLRIH
ncbi:MAG: SMI1/KNR4 family protein [Rhodobacteraceae bacterium]|nr:SMI1/KNR4 family protein [Paracoccaceae bacterium]